MTYFEWQNLEYPVILCPPMDGITDFAFRELIAQMGGTPVRYCEFINVKGLMYQNPKTLFELQYSEKQRPIIAQLFGSYPEDFSTAAEMIVEMGFDAIDINMGCPAHKVASKGSGCALMDDSQRSVEILQNVIKSASKRFYETYRFERKFPVTCKMRLGVQSKDQVYDHALAMAKAGAQAIAIHGRTLKQMYTGEADWTPLRHVLDSLQDEFGEARPKLFGSGDVTTITKAFENFMLYGVDGVMIGRGSFGNPWIFQKEKVQKLKEIVTETRASLLTQNKKYLEDLSQIPNLGLIHKELESISPDFDEIAQIAIHHAELMLQNKGEKGIVQMRKHLGWYFQNFHGAKVLRSELVRVNSIDEIKICLQNFRKNI